MAMAKAIWPCLSKIKTVRKRASHCCSGTAPVIIGAGRALGNGGDDFSWLELWHVEDQGSFQDSYHEKFLKLKADGIAGWRGQVCHSDTISALASRLTVNTA